MHNVFQHNREILQQHWPEIWAVMQADAANTRLSLQVINGRAASLQAAGLDLSSRYDPVTEAETQAEPIPADASEAWIYGIGLGFLPQILLQRSTITLLHVVILNPVLFYQTLEYVDHSYWLQDSRIRLHLGRDETSIMHPFCVVPPCLDLAEDLCARIRDLLSLELNTAFINEQFLAKADTLRQKIQANREFIEKDAPIDTLTRACIDKTALVVAAGPSLDSQFKTLRRLHPANCLIALDAALRPLLIQGIVPDYVVTIDSTDEHVINYFAGDLAPLSGSGLVYYPVVAHRVLKLWPGRRFIAYSQSSLYDEIRNKHPAAQLYSAGSVFHAAVDLAVKMSAKKIILFGADFGFPGNRIYADSIAREVRADEFQSKDCWVVNGVGEKIPTQNNLRGYLRDLERYISAQHNVMFVNASRDGAMISGAHYLDDASFRETL